jgi:outer membrane protein assembly factor BamB
MKKALAALATLFVIDFASAQSVEWIRRESASQVDFARGVSADGLGSVYISGVAFGTGILDPDPYPEAFVRKYDSAGTLVWSREFGTLDWEEGYGVSADGLGSIYTVGLTEGELGGPHLGGQDAFIAKYNEDGTHQWTRQFGTTADDVAYSVSADQLGSIFVAGALNGSRSQPESAFQDAFLSKYDSSGTLQWTQPFGEPLLDEVASGVSADGLGNVYVAGSQFRDGVVNAVPGDVFLSKYDSAGELQWTQPFGEPDEDERATGVSADGLGNIYVAFDSVFFDPITQYPTFGALRKYDDTGALLWTYDLEPMQSIAGVSADGLGNVYISSNPVDDLVTSTYVSKISGSGELLWTLITFQDDEETINMARSLGVSADGLGNVYSAGLVDVLEPFGGVNFDAFLTKISVPEPTSFVLLIVCSVLGTAVRRSR